VDRGLSVGRKIDYHDDPAAPEPNSGHVEEIDGERGKP
jgi:hypothetical protein